MKELINRLKSHYTGRSVMSGQEYLSRRDAFFSREDLPGEQTIIIEFNGISDTERIFLKKRGNTAVLPEAWKGDNRSTQILTILHDEGYETQFEPIMQRMGN